MLCDEKLEVFENGFEDGKFKVRVEFYGNDARRLLLTIIRELYLPDYGEDYVYPFECAKEFWGIPLEAGEIVSSEVESSPLKFINRSVIERLKKALLAVNIPVEVRERINLERARIVKVGKRLVAIGRDFLLDEGGCLITFTKPSMAELILKYLGMLNET
ncbi:PH1570 family protein [Thermococcus sp.]|uniref:PH1570 family protein n=1 Tax=Thermococcus sp. TaxID=35749 RepID=UPI00260929DA|nr:PH1570 family protein [Thermococcus sp.]